MSILHLSEAEVKSILTMDDAVRITEEMFISESKGKVEHFPTTEFGLPGGMFRLKAGGTYGMNTFGWKAYGGGGRRIVYLYDINEGLVGILDAIHLTQVRTGAVSAVATRHMARGEAETIGIIGTGKEARTQLEALNVVRNLKHVKAYSRNPENREGFASDMTERLGVEVEPVESAEEAVRDVDIIVTITRSAEPILFGDWLPDGVHINGVGATGAFRRELDDAAIGRCATVVVEHMPVAVEECGELIHAVSARQLRWPLVRELKDIVAGTIAARKSAKDITLFDSIGIGSEDVAIATEVLAKARKAGIGTVLPM